MKTLKKLLVITTIVVMAPAGAGVVRAIRIAQTNEIMALLIVSISNYHGNLRDLLDDNLFIKKIVKQNPKFITRENTLLDAWRSPIQIRIKSTNSEFVVILRSSGPDRVFGTTDDIIKKESYNLEKIN